MMTTPLLGKTVTASLGSYCLSSLSYLSFSNTYISLRPKQVLEHRPSVKSSVGM